MSINFGKGAGITFKKEREVFGVCPWCAAEVYCYTKKDEKGKIDWVSYYCSEKCGFNLNPADQTFITRIGRKIAEAEAKKMISKKLIVLDIKKRNGNGTYKGEFYFKARVGSNEKTYCNIICEPLKKTPAPAGIKKRKQGTA